MRSLATVLASLFLISCGTAAAATYELRVPARGLSASVSSGPVPDGAITLEGANFGIVTVGTTGYAYAKLANPTGVPIQVTNVTLPAGVTRAPISGNDCPTGVFTIQPGLNCQIHVQWTPTAVTTLYDHIIVAAAQQGWSISGLLQGSAPAAPDTLAGTITSIAGGGPRFTVGPDSKTIYYAANEKLYKLIPGQSAAEQPVAYTDTCSSYTSAASKLRFRDVAYDMKSGKLYISGECIELTYRTVYYPLQLLEVDLATMSGSVVYTIPQQSSAVFTQEDALINSSRLGYVWMSHWRGSLAFSTTSHNAYGVSTSSGGNYGAVYADTGKGYEYPVAVTQDTSSGSQACTNTQMFSNQCTSFTWNSFGGWSQAPNGNLYAIRWGSLREIAPVVSKTGIFSLNELRTIMSGISSGGKLVVAPDGSLYTFAGSTTYHIQ